MAIAGPLVPSDTPHPRLWTRDEYYRAAQLGLFSPDERLELIEGEIIQKMPQNPPHAASIGFVEDALAQVTGMGYHLRVQMPLDLSELSQPEPDVAVVVGSRRDYERHHPTTAALVVEISDASLGADRRDKARIYAVAGVPEYWILNLPKRLLEVYREPQRTLPGEERHPYAVILSLSETETVFPLVAPNLGIHAADLLPTP